MSLPEALSNSALACTAVNAPTLPWRPKSAPTTVTQALFRADAKVEGQWPAWLQGTLMRTAPAIFELGKWRAQHWFDGLGMVFSFTVSPQKVVFAQRLLDSYVARAAQEGAVDVSSFGSPNQRGFFKRLFEPIPRTTDNTNVNVLKVGPGWVAYTETQHQLQVIEDSLATNGEVKFEDELPPRVTMTAHPHWDPARDQVVNVGVSLGPEVTVSAFDYPTSSPKRRVFGKYVSKELAYMHSFALTPEDAVVIAHPWMLKPLKLMWSNKGFGEHFDWRPERGSKVLVFDRTGSGGAPAVFETETLYVFHCANAFRDGEDRVVDVISYPDTSIIDTLKVSSLQPRIIPVKPALKRIRIKPRGSATVETLMAEAFELPAISYRKFNGQKYRCLYGSTISCDGKDVVKVDLDSGTTKTFGETGYVFGEPVMVARPGGTDEDDGVVLTVGSNGTRSQLAVLDARTFEPLSRAYVELPIPLGFHGSFTLS